MVSFDFTGSFKAGSSLRNWKPNGEISAGPNISPVDGAFGKRAKIDRN